MGYCTRLTDSRFTIPAKHFPDAVRDLLAMRLYSDEDYARMCVASARAIMVDPAIVAVYRPHRALPPLLSLGNLSATFGEAGITGISFDGEKAGWGEAEVLATLAAYVDSGCFLEFTGEDGDSYRYIFVNGGMGNVSPQVTWPDTINESDEVSVPDEVVRVRAPKRKTRK